MPDPKKGDKGGPSTGDLAPASLIAVLEDLLASLRDKAQPLFDQIRAIEQVLENAKDNQFLEERRQERAFERQEARQARATSPGGGEATAAAGPMKIPWLPATGPTGTALAADGATRAAKPGRRRGAANHKRSRVTHKSRGGTEP